jgi:predicted transposase YbfD/YdcC
MLMSACSSSFHTATDADHGRIETRVSAVSTDVAWLQERHQWPGHAAIGKVTCIREAAGKTTTETAYYLLSAPLAANRFHEAVRHHWGIENSLHWVLDVTMNEDQSRNRKDHSPENRALLRRLALNLAKREPSRGSIKAKQSSNKPDGITPSSQSS